MRSKYLDWRDCIITIFNDDEKCLSVFVNDRGTTKTINYDSNFFYVEELIDTYIELCVDSFKGWRNRALTGDDYAEIRGYVRAYIRHLKRAGCEIDRENIRNDYIGVFTL